MLHNLTPDRDPEDRLLNVTFAQDVVPDEQATEEAGRPIYKSVERVIITGFRDGFGQHDNTLSVNTVVNASHKKRFPREYAAFKAANTVHETDGTPLKMWPAITPVQVAELAAVGLFSVEQVAELEPKELRMNPWLAPVHEKACLWLDSLKSGEVVLGLRARIDRLEREVQALEAEKADLILSIQNQGTKKAPRARTE